MFASTRGKSCGENFMEIRVPLSLQKAFDDLPLVAILRGIPTADAQDIAVALCDSGFRIIEVPLNSPDPFETIATMVQQVGERAVIGAGTVMTKRDLRKLADCGGRIAVMPHCHPPLISAAVEMGLHVMPGVATPSEAFAAIRAGATDLKMFPGESMPPKVVKAWKAVMPEGVRLFPVGGIAPETMADYKSAGANGFGIGSALYKPGISAEDIGVRARGFVEAWQAL